MKLFSKIATILVASVFAFSFFGCKNASSDDDGNSRSKLEAPTNLVINSIEDATMTVFAANVNISFNYNGKFDGATYGILGYSTTNDSSKAIYDEYNSTVHVKAGSNTRTANIQNLALVEGKKYYFWLKITCSNYNVSDSDWSNVAEFTYNK